MRQNVLFACMFCALFIGTNFANKYVLSVLKFTYPTIFQGWQTFVGVVMFRALLSTGHIDGLLHGKEWHECALWLPGMMCFLLSIYSGSRALANLPIPVFFVMQNIVLVFKATAELLFHGQITSVYSYFMLMISLCSALAVAKTDPQFEPEGYWWMCVHIVSIGVFEIYTNLMRGRLKLR
ncbi:transmembrane protein 241 [Aplysia californica]|uniref:Transmembrane protein 241 n=1 Tax=Aplysia californica TaxID=6500 RepID=A0ABM1A2S2_APLCA|nr:transmembrane protein 241 [Aplysia californica]